MPHAYINNIGKFLPGNPIENDEIETYLGQVNGRPSRVRKRILKSNGIRQRHYALDRQQQTTHSNSQMAAAAIREALAQQDLEPEAIDLLCAATSWPDLLLPGFASMVHGELPELPPLETISTQGVCCSGVSALQHAAGQIQLGRKRAAIAVASELASRLFKHTQFEAESRIQAGESPSFDSEFLRWMLSDGAGALLLQDRPNPQGLSLRVEWIELISHANAYPVCMYAGTADDTATKSWLDYPSYAEAVQDGAINLRQNIRLLDDVIKLGVEGWLRLIEAGRVKPDEIDWLLCHYSSHFFRGKIVELLDKAGCLIPESKWFTNLYTRGNTGCASIYLMLEELFHTQPLVPGQKIFCFVPESGRFTTAYMLLTAVGETNEAGEGAIAPPVSTDAPLSTASPLAQEFPRGKDTTVIPVQTGIQTSSPGSDRDPVAQRSPLRSNHETGDSSVQSDLLRQLALVWLEFERQLRSVPIVRRLHRGDFTLDDYKALLRNLRPQVVEGARWIARAASYMTDFQLRSTFIGHAQDEHRDYQMLERNYVSVGGDLCDIVQAEKNIGSEALSAFIFQQASQNNPIDLIGSMFIIEGLGNRLAGQWAEKIRDSLGLEDRQVSFLAYHGENDESHIGKLEALVNAEWMTADIARRIVKTAKVTARLYVMQLEEIES